MLIQQTRMLQTASHPQQKHQNHYLLRNSQPSGCKEEGVRDPLPCTAPTANLLASCLILTEWGWGREIPHINSHNQSYKGEKKKKSTVVSKIYEPPWATAQKKQRHTHIHTRSEGKRDPTCSFIPLSCSLTATWAQAVQRGSTQRVWLWTAEQQPRTSNVHVIKAWHCSFWVILKHQRNPPMPLWPQLNWNKLSPDIPANGVAANSPGIRWDWSMSHHCLHPRDVPIWTSAICTAPSLTVLPQFLEKLCFNKREICGSGSSSVSSYAGQHGTCRI